MITAWVVGIGEPFEWEGPCPVVGDVIEAADGRRGGVVEVRQQLGFWHRDAQGNVRTHHTQIRIKPEVV